MRKKSLFFSAVVLGVVAFGMTAAPALAVPPAGKAYAAFWEFNIGGTGGPIIGDCIEFTNSRVCSLSLGKCWGYTLGELDGTVQTWSATLKNVPFLGPIFFGVNANLRISVDGVVELRGPGSSGNLAGLIEYPRAARGNLSLDMQETAACAFLKPGGARRMPSNVESLAAIKRAGGETPSR